MSQTIIQVDAFTERRFAGNPAAVCILSDPPDDAWMQDVAREMNLSETAFLVPQNGGFLLRWFTPTFEVELCGHATLASAHVLWEEGYLKPEEVARFYTLSGILTARREGTWIELDFPAKRETAVIPPEHLLQALGVAITYVGRNDFDYFVEVASEEMVRELKPNYALLREVDTRGVIVTSCARREADYDFVSRFFSGVDEDPVTGSVYCCLTPYWSQKLGRKELIGYQASQRGGYVRTRVEGDRVYLGGQAVTVMRGELI
jgi:predicted PhzF superfamily epimerase YddE/YHI9